MSALASTSHYTSTRFYPFTTTNHHAIRIHLQFKAKASSNELDTTTTHVDDQEPNQVFGNNDNSTTIGLDKVIKKLQMNGLKVVQKTAVPRASTAIKNPAVPGSTLYKVFEVQAYASLLVGGALSFNLIFPSNEPDLWRLMGMWSIWMFSRLKCRFQALLPCTEQSARRTFIVTSLAFPVLAFLNRGITIKPALAEEGSNNEEEEGVVGALKSLFDPNEKTKSGKTLPKAYLKSAREVVKTLRESLNEDTKDNAKFRRTADSAKESIREYLSSWRGEKTVVKEESYVMLEKAIRALASFYSKAGPSAALPENVKAEILSNLNIADESL